MNAIRSRFRYRGEDQEIVRTPEFMLHDLKTLGYCEGDCDDISTLVAAVVRVWNIPARFAATIYTPGVTNFQHVFVEVLDSGKWITLDLTTPPGTIQRWLKRMEEYL